MEDAAIVQLYWDRDEAAIDASRSKYGAYCAAVAGNILRDTEDVKECVSDTWLVAWNTMPPQRPARLGAFLSRITRNLSLKRWRETSALKRGGGTVTVALEELSQVLPDRTDPEAIVEAQELGRVIDRFLRSLPRSERQLFLRRYWYLETIRDLADSLNWGESRVKMTLMRTREKLKQTLQQEGMMI